MYIYIELGVNLQSNFSQYLVPVWQMTPIAENFRAIMYNLHSENNRKVALDNLFKYLDATLTDLIVIVQDSSLGIGSPFYLLLCLTKRVI